MSTSYHHDKLYDALSAQVPRNLIPVVDVDAIDHDLVDYSASFLELHNTLFLFKPQCGHKQYLLLPSLEKLVLDATSGNGLTEGRALHFVVKNWANPLSVCESDDNVVEVLPAGSTGELIHDSVSAADLVVQPGESRDFLIKLEFLPEDGRRNGCGVSPLGCGAVSPLAVPNTHQAEPSGRSNAPTTTDCCSDRLAIARACKARYVLYVSGCCRAQSNFQV